MFTILMLGPAVGVLLVLTTFPIAYLVGSSLYQLNPSAPAENGWVGLGNYVALVHDRRLWHALVLTAIYTVSTVVLQVSIGLGMALLALRARRGQVVLRTGAILPVVLAPAVVGMVWRSLLLTPQYGVVDFLGIALGFGSHNWLGSPQLALISVIAMHTWQWTPFAFLVLLAGLSALPPEPFEAASIDGASSMQRFRYITLPLIRPSIVIVVILRSAVALSAFAAIYAATGGGPGTATEILNLYVYKMSFVQLSLGYGSAIAVVLLFITLGFSAVLFRARTAA